MKMKMMVTVKTSLIAGIVCLFMSLAGSVNADMIAHWSFEGDLTDAIGAFDGTATGNNISVYVDDSPVGLGKALLLDGNGVNCGNVKSPTGSLDVSYALWVKTTDATPQYGNILSKCENQTSQTPWGYSLMPRRATQLGATDFFIGRMGAQQTYGGWGEELKSESYAVGDFWTHVVFTYDHDVDIATFYINGLLSGTMTGIRDRGVLGAANVVQNLYLGAGTPSGWKGLIDEVAIWDHALTAQEAMDVYSVPNLTPENGAAIDAAAASSLTLSWDRLAMDPNFPGPVDVYFSALDLNDPNNVGPATRVVDAEAVSSVNVDASVAATYYWRIDYYRGLNLIEGDVLSFTTFSDFPPKIDSITPDQMTWTGEPVELAVAVTNDVTSTTVYSWTGESVDNVDITIDGDDTATPTVTVTKLPSYKFVIPNAGFELPDVANDTHSHSTDPAAIPGWTLDTALGGGVGDPGGSGMILVEAMEGEQHAWIMKDSSLKTVTDATVTAGETYNLSAYVASSRWSGGEDVQYKIQLLAVDGETEILLAEDGGTITVDDEWNLSETSYTHPAADPNNVVGLPLMIKLDSAGSAGHVLIDDVVLSFTEGAPLPPVSGIDTVTMTVKVSDAANPPIEASVEIDVYDDACHLYKTGEGKPVAETDFNADCTTNLSDFAIMAAAWLDDYSTPGPSDKP